MGYVFTREPLTTENQDKLSNACESVKEKLIIWTLLDTGLRISELTNLKDKDILWQEKALRVTQGKAGPFGGPKKRVVPLIAERSRKLLENYFADHTRWFVRRRQASEIITAVANRAKITQKVSAHILRHTYACNCLQKGISVASLSKVMGHSSMVTTNIYLQFTNVHIVEEFQRKW